MTSRRLFRLSAIALAALLSACASTPPAGPPAQVAATPQLPAAWLAPLPHQGSATELARWWQRFDDPVLVGLIDRAQAASPTVQAATARLAQARAEAQQASAGLLPQVQAGAQATRAKQAPDFRPATTSGAQFSASWELDLFGRARAQGAAAQAQAEAAQAQWHEARVSLAADVASAYLVLSHAQAQEEIAELDVQAAEALAQWGQLRRQRGLDSASDAALLNTQRAAAVAVRADQRAQTAIALQTLALLTAQPAADLGATLAPAPVQAPRLQRRVPAAPPFAWSTLPPQTLAQRPDLAASHQQWLAAAYSEQGVRAEAWPQLSLTGLIGNARLGWGSGSTGGAVWSIGPSLSLPLFDGGLRQGQRDAAQARTAQAAAAFEARWRGAVAEVEEALQLVASAGERQREADTSQQEWERIAADATRLAQAGVQSGPQRAATFRNALSAYSAAVAIRHEHAQAWVRLYRVLGGGFDANSAATATAGSAPTPPTSN